MKGIYTLPQGEMLGLNMPVVIISFSWIQIILSIEIVCVNWSS